jgi:NAD(P)-dependent dehydrogenase (short-subunit alcohol dehydrogenase family)
VGVWATFTRALLSAVFGYLYVYLVLSPAAPTRRSSWARPEKVGGAIAFLLGAGASAVTGVGLPVPGRT